MTGTACGVAHRFRIGYQAKTADKPCGCCHPDDGNQRSHKGGHFTATTRKLVKNQQAVVAVGGSTERQSDIIHVSHPALDSVAASTGQDERAQPPTRENLTIIRKSLNAAIEQELRRTADDRLFFQLTSLRTELNRDIQARLVQTEETAERTPAEVLPALVLAASWYDDASRETDIPDRNAISHPGFVPVRALRVPVR